jgi:hypothetical protein
MVCHIEERAIFMDALGEPIMLDQTGTREMQLLPNLD